MREVLPRYHKGQIKVLTIKCSTLSFQIGTDGQGNSGFAISNQTVES